MKLKRITSTMLALLMALSLFVTPVFAADKTIAATDEMVGSGHATKTDTLNRLSLVEHYTDGTHKYGQMVVNLKPTVNVAVNKLDVFAKSNGAAPSATNVIAVAIPDGTGYTFRTRAAAVASGTGQIVLADAANYWSKGSLDAEIKTMYLYAIWSTADNGIVWAVSGYSGFTRVPAAGGAATDDDWFLLEGSSSYTAVITDYCVAVAKISYQYDTADTPDHTIQATVLDAPQIMWNPKSDYGYQKNLATSISGGTDYSEQTMNGIYVKQSGKYIIFARVRGYVDAGTVCIAGVYIKVGSSTYGTAVYIGSNKLYGSVPANYQQSVSTFGICYLNTGDYIHHGASLEGNSGNRIITGDNVQVGTTSFSFMRID